jgi:hypothetical protein
MAIRTTSIVFLAIQTIYPSVTAIPTRARSDKHPSKRNHIAIETGDDRLDSVLDAGHDDTADVARAMDIGKHILF